MAFDFSQSELIKMQNEAVINARNMQKRAKLKGDENSKNGSFQREKTAPKTDEKYTENSTFKEKEKKAESPYLKPFFMEIMFAETNSQNENEQRLLLTFILILIFDKGDKILIFALMYIML